jgi:hypothetical protein
LTDSYRAVVVDGVVVVELDGVVEAGLWPGAFSELPGPF